MLQILTPTWSEYELLDSGNKEKLERFGKFIVRRSEGEALWKPSLPISEWEKANASFDKEKGEWKRTPSTPVSWPLRFNNLTFTLKLTPFGHVGVFPEQVSQWEMIDKKITSANREVKVLSLFGYTGAATLVAASAGGHVTHVDASRPAITWAVENQSLSNLNEKPIRWLIDDALKFVKREERRENKYDVILMDPPKFGRGPKGEVWQFEDSYPTLLQACRNILSKNPLLISVTAYAIPISAITLGNTVKEIMKDFSGETIFGELTLQEKTSERLLSTSIFANWQSK